MLWLQSWTLRTVTWSMDYGCLFSFCFFNVFLCLHFLDPYRFICYNFKEEYVFQSCCFLCLFVSHIKQVCIRSYKQQYVFCSCMFFRGLNSVAYKCIRTLMHYRYRAVVLVIQGHFQKELVDKLKFKLSSDSLDAWKEAKSKQTAEWHINPAHWYDPSSLQRRKATEVHRICVEEKVKHEEEQTTHASSRSILSPLMRCLKTLDGPKRAEGWCLSAFWTSSKRIPKSRQTSVCSGWAVQNQISKCWPLFQRLHDRQAFMSILAILPLYQSDRQGS